MCRASAKQEQSPHLTSGAYLSQEDVFLLFAGVPDRHLYSQSSPHTGGVKSGQTSGGASSPPRLTYLLDAAALEWAGYLKWPDCPLFMTSCLTAQIVFATFSHLKGQRRKDVGITYRLRLSRFDKDFLNSSL